MELVRWKGEQWRGDLFARWREFGDWKGGEAEMGKARCSKFENPMQTMALFLGYSNIAGIECFIIIWRLFSFLHSSCYC